MIQPLLILDLDETLIFGTEVPLALVADMMVDVYSIYKRPHLAEFLASVRPLYRLAVWTVSTRSYAEPIVKCIFPPDAPLEFLWCRDRCTWRQDAETHEGYWLKNQKKLKRLGYDLDRVLFVDDTPRNLERNYGNHVHIAPYTGEPDDVELLFLAKYLTSIVPIPNLRALEKRQWRKEIGKANS